MEKMVRKRLNFKNFPSLVELEKKSTMVFVNTDSSFDNQQPLQPNMIRISGLQIQKPKELPKVFLEHSKKKTIFNSKNVSGLA